MPHSQDALNLQFYPIRINHRDQLWEFAVRSKAYWKYPREYLEAVREQLKLSAIQIGQGWGEIATDQQHRWLGYYFIIPSAAFECRLEHLWVEPEYIGSGVDQQLLQKAIQSVKSAGFHDALRVFSDPGAEAFYLKNGFRRMGELTSRVEGGPLMPELLLKIL